MKKTRDLVMEDYKQIKDILTVMGENHNDYEKVAKDKDAIRKELIQIATVEIENETKRLEIETENKREKVRNRIAIGTFAITSVISIWAVVKTFKFDEEGTVTSTLGRGILSGIMPKFKK